MFSDYKIVASALRNRQPRVVYRNPAGGKMWDSPLTRQLCLLLHQKRPEAKPPRERVCTESARLEAQPRGLVGLKKCMEARTEQALPLRNSQLRSTLKSAKRRPRSRTSTRGFRTEPAEARDICAW
jgi:hypothetical protein